MRIKLTVEKAREEVAKCSQKMAEGGLVLGTWGNVSCYLPDEGYVIITPSGVPYQDMHPNKTVIVDLKGEIVEGDLKPSSETKVHLGIYVARPEIQGIVHTHSSYASALAVANIPIPPILEDMAALIGGEVPVSKYAIAGSDALAKNVVAAMGKRNAVLMAQHGVVGCGADLDEAMKVCIMVERCAKIYLLAKQAGEPKVLSDKDVANLYQYFKSGYGQQ